MRSDKWRFVVGTFVCLWLWIGVPERSHAGASDESRIYVLYSNPQHFHWAGYPYRSRSFTELSKLAGAQLWGNLTSNLPPEFMKSDVLQALTTDRRQAGTISRQFERMRKKGYSVVEIEDVNIGELLEAVRSPKTKAIFYASSGYIESDNDAEAIKRGEKEAFLSVSIDGKPSALTDTAVQNAARETIQAGANLDLFYAYGAFIGFSEGPMRKRLGLGSKVKFVTPRDEYNGEPASSVYLEHIVKSFESDVAAWVDGLPDISNCDVLSGSAQKAPTDAGS